MRIFHHFSQENEEELFLRLFYKEDRKKMEKPPKSPLNFQEKPDERHKEKFLSILGKFGPERDRTLFVSENYRKKI